MTLEDKRFVEDLLFKYFGSRLGTMQALNGGGTLTLGAGVASQVFEQNALRNVATIVNTDAALDVYLNFASNTAIQTTGILLRPGGAITFGRGTDIPYTGRVFAISVGAPVIVFTELSLER